MSTYCNDWSTCSNDMSTCNNKSTCCNDKWCRILLKVVCSWVVSEIICVKKSTYCNDKSRWSIKYAPQCYDHLYMPSVGICRDNTLSTLIYISLDWTPVRGLPCELFGTQLQHLCPANPQLLSNEPVQKKRSDIVTWITGLIFV